MANMDSINYTFDLNATETNFSKEIKSKISYLDNISYGILSNISETATGFVETESNNRYDINTEGVTQNLRNVSTEPLILNTFKSFVNEYGLHSESSSHHENDDLIENKFFGIVNLSQEHGYSSSRNHNHGYSSLLPMWSLFSLLVFMSALIIVICVMLKLCQNF